MNYIEVTFDITPYEEAVADALISELGTIGYDGFSYTDQGFTAYIPAKDYNAQAITRLEIFDFFTRNYRIETSVQEIEDQDWNKVWEENFTPIVVDDRILVRAGFHARYRSPFHHRPHATHHPGQQGADYRQTGTRHGMRNRYPVYPGCQNRCPGNHRHRHR